MMPWLWWLWSSLAAPAPLAPVPPPRACGVLGPTESELQQWLARDPGGDDHRWRMRLSALAPQITMGGHSAIDNDLQSNKQPGVAETIQQDQGTGQRLEAQLRWQLSDVVFHPRELESERNRSKVEQQQQDRRLKIVDVFYARMEQRQRCLVSTDDDDAALARREAARLAATLQVLTDGWFLMPNQTPPEWD
jgi:hypothetical protein